jgi:hypothetical protein
LRVKRKISRDDIRIGTAIQLNRPAQGAPLPPEAAPGYGKQPRLRYPGGPGIPAHPATAERQAAETGARHNLSARGWQRNIVRIRCDFSTEVWYGMIAFLPQNNQKTLRYNI